MIAFKIVALLCFLAFFDFGFAEKPKPGYNDKKPVPINVKSSMERLESSPDRNLPADQKAFLYDYYNQYGDSAELIDYAPYLYQYNFNDRASSGVFNGIWILYDGSNYNVDNLNDGSSTWVWGTNYATNLDPQFDNIASSIRFTGAPDGYQYDTLNLYEGEGFNGGEEYTYTDIPQMNFDNRAKSLIVTGCQPWTIYQYDDYQGYSCCVFPSDSYNCFPGFHPLAKDLGGLANHISSARLGCFSQNDCKTDVTQRSKVESDDIDNLEASADAVPHGSGSFIAPKAIQP